MIQKPPQIKIFFLFGFHCASAFSCYDRAEKSEWECSCFELPCFNICRLFCRHFCLRPYLRTAGSLSETLVIHNIRELKFSVKNVLQCLNSIRGLCNSHELLRILIKLPPNHLNTCNRLPRKLYLRLPPESFPNRFG